MAAQMKVSKWQVEPAKRGNIEVTLDGEPEGRYASIAHAGDYVWVSEEDIPALIKALQAAAVALTEEQ